MKEPRCCGKPAAAPWLDAGPAAAWAQLLRLQVLCASSLRQRPLCQQEGSSCCVHAMKLGQASFSEVTEDL